MELQQIRYFITAAEELSMTAAAKRMHVSQPALSRQIATLEEDLGVPLFDRIKKRIYLTEAGKFFLTRARQIICDVETSAQQVQEKFGERDVTLRLGFMTPFLDDIVTPAIMQLRSSGSRVNVSLQDLPPQAQIDRVRDGELDLALLGNISPEDKALYGSETVFRSRMGIVLPDNDPRSSRKQLSLKEFAGEPFVSLSDTFFPDRRLFMQKMAQEAGFEAEIAVECDSIPLMIGCVTAGDGIGVLPMHCRKLPHTGCQFIPMKSPVAYAEVISVFRNESLCGNLVSLIEALRESGSRIAE